ncbi:MAG: hypothetical protein ACRYG2_11215, partial [Janthinobacterium lividum]
MIAPTLRARSQRPAMRRLVPLATAGALLALPVLAGCTDNAPTTTGGASADPRALSVAASDTA